MNRHEEIAACAARENDRQDGEHTEILTAPNYEQLYHQLFNALTDQIESMKAIQQEAEESYIKQSCVITVPKYICIKQGGRRV